MNNPGIVVMKIIALAGGAALGALLARWFDDFLASQAKERSDYDKSRYEQGLAPVSPPPSIEDQQS
jgi:hypothetical protein